MLLRIFIQISTKNETLPTKYNIYYNNITNSFIFELSYYIYQQLIATIGDEKFCDTEQQGDFFI